MRTWNLSHGVRLADDKQVLDFSKIVLGVSFNGTPVRSVSEVYMMRNFYGLLTLRPGNQLDRACVGKAEPALNCYTRQELFDQDTHNRTS